MERSNSSYKTISETLTSPFLTSLSIKFLQNLLNILYIPSITFFYYSNVSYLFIIFIMLYYILLSHEHSQAMYPDRTVVYLLTDEIEDLRYHLTSSYVATQSPTHLSAIFYLQGLYFRYSY